MAKSAGFGNSLQPNEAGCRVCRQRGECNMQNGQRQAIKSMLKLIYLCERARALHKIDKLRRHLQLTGGAGGVQQRERGQRGARAVWQQ